MTILSLHVQLAHTAVFSPRLQHAVRLLQMSTLDYVQEMQDAALTNPLLDVGSLEDAGEFVVPTPLVQPEAPIAGDAEFEWAQDIDRMTRNEPAAKQRLLHDDGVDMLQQVPVRVCPRAHFHAQLGVLRLEAHERFLAKGVIEALDDDGYLRLSLDELAVALSYGRADIGAELRTALCRVQSESPRD